MSNKTRTSRNPIFKKNFFHDLPPELQKNIKDKIERPVNYDDNKKMYSNTHYVRILGSNVENPIKITYVGDIRKTTYKVFFDNNIYNDYKDFYNDYIFIINFADGNSKRIKCDNRNIFELDNYKITRISQKNIETDIISVEIVLEYEEYEEDDILRGGRKAPVVKKEINGKLRCIYKITGSRKEHLKYKGRLITVADYKKLMKNNVIIRKLFGGEEEIKEIIQKKQ